jgi:hypothetical protein
MTRAGELVASIRERLPPGMSLPGEFRGFVELVTDERGRDMMNVAWSDACPLLNADDAAGEVFVPFLLLGDGGVVALADAAGLSSLAGQSQGRSPRLLEDPSRPGVAGLFWGRKND